jgi:hypothetical protein
MTRFMAMKNVEGCTISFFNTFTSFRLAIQSSRRACYLPAVLSLNDAMIWDLHAGPPAQL